MSGRNRRRRPADAVETRRIAAGIENLLPRVERLYLALLSSGYTKPHRDAIKSASLGDPADMVSGTPERVRHHLTRASEGLDAAHDGVANAAYWLSQIVTLLDAHAAPGGVDEDLPTASGAEVRQAEKAQVRRTDRARSSGVPWAFDEVTG